jgi:hypothetical protein
MTVSESPYPKSPYPKPGVKDWALLAINIVFVALGLFILLHERDVGIVTLAFFGPCLIVSGGAVLRKLRFRRFRALKAEIVGGVPIRASRAQALATGLVLLLMGVIIVLFGRSYPLIMWMLAWLCALIGGALTIAVLSGLIPNDYLKFDPEGITFGRARYSYMVPWDTIAQVSTGHVHNNPALFISLHGYEGVTVHPREKRDQVLKSFAWGTGWAGAPIMLLPSRYGIDLPMLMLALERYLTEPTARRELAHRLIPRAEPSPQPR